MIDEPTYRQQVDTVFKRIDAAFEDVDPDLAESDFSQGSLIITFKQTHKLILSPQAPLRQIWLAFKNRAWHMQRDAERGQWLDDRGQGVELLALVHQLAQESTGVALSFG